MNSKLCANPQCLRKHWQAGKLCDDCRAMEAATQTRRKPGDIPEDIRYPVQTGKDKDYARR